MSVVFTDVVPSTHGTPDLHEIARNQSHVSVAKFYKGDKALEIVAILRSGRSYGYVLPTPAASTDYFPQFNQELLAGALVSIIHVPQVNSELTVLFPVHGHSWC